MNKVPERHSRQSFLGEKSYEIFARSVVGIAGLGGGGSHIVQQLAHIGIRNFVLYDADHVEESNLNRLVGAVTDDVRRQTPKVDVAERIIKGLWPQALIRKFKKRWQDEPIPLRSCDLVFGCLDGFAERGELESSTRRYLIPLIDIGMTVQPPIAGQPYRMSGQVILSMPGGPCMRCMGFLNEATLAQEAARYGAAGPNPQVVWANGVLASTAVGLCVELLTGWTRRQPTVVYMSYDGNGCTLTPHVRAEYVSHEPCQHFPPSQSGDPIYLPL